MEDLTQKLTMLLALTSPAMSSEMFSLNIKYLMKHSPGYTLYLGKNTKISKKTKPGDPIIFHSFSENRSLCVYQHIEKKKGNKETTFTASV